MLSKIVKWLFQLPGRLFGGVFRSRLTIFIFFMLIAVGMFSTKRYLRAHQNDDEFVSAPPTDYNRAIQREMPLREAREHCGGPLHDNAGQPWPSSAGYLHQPENKVTGRSQQLTLDNQSNDFPVLVKLETPNQPQQLAEVFIPAAGSFNITTKPAGEYVMKIRNIKSGCNFRSKPFTLGNHQDWRLPLNPQTDGSVQLQPISDREF